MAITPEQRVARRNHVGGSDVSAIMGLNPWRTAHDVWLEKTGRLLDTDEPPSAAADAGARFEPAVLGWAAERLGRLTTAGAVLELRHTSLPIVCHPDALVMGNGEPVEAKTSGLLHIKRDDSLEWGEEGSDVVPVHYFIQAMVEGMCAKGKACNLPAFIGGRGFVMYRIEPDGEIAQRIADDVGQFWEKCVKADTPPEGVIVSLDVSKRRVRTAGKEVEVEESAVKRWMDSKAAAEAATEEEELAKAELLTRLGDAEQSQLISGIGRVTYRQQLRGGLDTKRMRADLGEAVVRPYLTETPMRVLRVVKA